ncbi:GNAT family N-acetyltransferase [Chitinophaga sp. RCC_12]|uniref:GNAT family N-acetyltransferase n=1 Tax=Chitinophaga sp. RCC_12 TaxID=3239226 RepID=UPI0035263E2D
MEIRDYTGGDENEIIKLFELVFGKPMPIAYWRWRFKDNPCNKYAIKLMWNEQKLIGHYAVSPVLLDVAGKQQLTGLSMTTMTHPEYTGLGIFQQLSEALYKDMMQIHGMTAVWGFPNNNSHRGFIKNLDWKDITTIPMMSCDVAVITAKKSASLSIVTKFTTQHEDLHTGIFNNYRVKVKRSTEYLNWRYINNPSNKYVILENTSGDEGFVVLKEFQLSGKKKELDIVEWCFADNERITKVVLQHLAALFPAEEYEKFNIWIPLKDGRHLSFEKLGFSNGLPVTYFGIRSFASQTVESADNWWFQLGDSDVY